MTYLQRKEKLFHWFNSVLTDQNVPYEITSEIQRLISKHVKKAYLKGFEDRKTLDKAIAASRGQDEILDPDTRSILYAKEQGWMK